MRITHGLPSYRIINFFPILTSDEAWLHYSWDVAEDEKQVNDMQRVLGYILIEYVDGGETITELLPATWDKEMMTIKPFNEVKTSAEINFSVGGKPVEIDLSIKRDDCA